MQKSERSGGKARQLAVLCLSVVLTLSVWFAGTAAVPAMLAEGLITRGSGAWLTASVQLGFVAGTLVSAVLSLADRRDPRRLFLASALLAALATLGQTQVAPSGNAALALRFMAGAAMAGVYPVGMKLAASWAKDDLGPADRDAGRRRCARLGATAPDPNPARRHRLAARPISAPRRSRRPEVVRSLPSAPARCWGARPPFRPSQALEAWRNKGLRLANLGYLGHMWELYAMWAWIGLFLAGVLGGEPGRAGPWVFAVMAAGAVSCVAAGLLADRWNRASVAALCMLASGTCALLDRTGGGGGAGPGRRRGAGLGRSASSPIRPSSPPASSRCLRQTTSARC